MSELAWHAEPSQPAALAELAMQLVAKAQHAMAVARAEFGNGLAMFAYPSEECAVLGIGCTRAAVRPDTIEHVLRSRFDDPARFGAWLPALFNDGSFFLLHRLVPAQGAPAQLPSAADCAEVVALLTR